ncbi:MAG: TnpV protein [Lachnospiraceae bacterium]|nr:TnpV protein [Lachnospiraceae bacterium]
MVAELEYKEVDGLLYPVLEIPDERENLARLGKYGRQAMKYLEENEPARYKNLLRTGRMTEKMLEVEEEANRMMEQLQKQYLIKNKPQDPSSTMEMWKLREQAKMMAEEIVLAEIVLKYH